MAKVYAMYKRPADPAAFDRYYYATHVPIARKLPGLRHYEVTTGPVTMVGGGDAPYHLLAILTSTRWPPSRPRSPRRRDRRRRPTSATSRRAASTCTSP